MTDKQKVSQEALDWAEDQIRSGALDSPLARNPDGTLKTVKDLIAEAKRRRGERP